MIPPLYQNPDKGGGILGWSNCFPTCTAMQIAMETGGTKQPTGADVRALCRNDDGTPDRTGGTRASQNVDAARRGWNVTLDARVMPFEDAWTLGARADAAVSVSISYAVIANTQFDGSPGFTGLHQVILSGGQVYDPLADGRRPGIPNAPDKWPKDLLRRAAGKYAGVGVGRASVVIARAPLVKPKRYSVLFTPGAFFTYGTAANSRARDDGFTKTTSAPCSAPFLIPWLTGKKRVVTITAGRLAGKWVEPGATHLTLREAT